VYSQVGWNLGAGSGESVRRSGAFVRTHHPVPGDLIFFGASSAHHVGIYVSPGKMVDAPHTGADVGLHRIYPGVLGFYHRRSATAFDSQPLRTKVSGTVTVRSTTGAAVPHGVVTVTTGPKCAQRVTRLRTNGLGDAGVSLLSGRYCFALTSAPRGYLTTPKVAVDLRSGKRVAVKIVPAYAKVMTTIHAVSGNTGIYGVRVAVYRADCGTVVSARYTNHFGAFKLPLQPGRYCLKIIGTPRSVYPTYAGKRVTVQSVVANSVSLAVTLR
jgi:hypothetical protein